jgi:hypothetical protein
MSPIIPGVIASQITGRLSTGSFESIQTVTVGSGGSASIDFNSIPQTYKHLQIRGISRDGRSSATANTMKIQFNGDTGSNYHYSLVGSDGTSTASYGTATSLSAGIAGDSTSPPTATSMMGMSIININDYTGSNYKVLLSIGGYVHDSTGNGEMPIWGSAWRNTNAISSIKLFPNASVSFTQYSQFALYGIKG